MRPGERYRAWQCLLVMRCYKPVDVCSYVTNQFAVHGIEVYFTMTGTQRRKQMIYQRRVARRAAKKAAARQKYANFEDVFSTRNLYNSFLGLRERFRLCSDGTAYVVQAPIHILHTHKKLMDGTYKRKPYKHGITHGRGKDRFLDIPYAEDRVVMNCLTKYCLMPLFEPFFIYDSYSGRKGRGPEFAKRRLEADLHKFYRKHGNDGYILLFDVKDFYNSIDTKIMSRLIRKYIKDMRIVRLLDQYILNGDDKGLSLGIAPSAILSTLYLNEVDHFIKDELRVESYGRYGDDGRIIHEDKDYLVALADAIGEKLAERGLHFNKKKTHIVKLSHGFRWLKVRWWLTDSGKVVKKINPEIITNTRIKFKKLRKLEDNGEDLMTYRLYTWMTWLKITDPKNPNFRYNAHFARMNMRRLYFDLFVDWEGCRDVLYQNLHT